MVRINVQAEDARRGLQDAAGRCRSAAPAWRVIGTRIKQSVLRNFRQGGWFPAVWPKSGRAMTAGGKTLIDKAILRNSFQVVPGSFSVSVGTAVKYAAVHQFGATIKAKNVPTTFTKANGKTGVTGVARPLTFRIGDKWISKYQVVIPPRPFLPVKDGMLHPDDRRFVDDQLGGYIATGKTSA